MGDAFLSPLGTALCHLTLPKPLEVSGGSAVGAAVLVAHGQRLSHPVWTLAESRFRFASESLGRADRLHHLGNDSGLPGCKFPPGFSGLYDRTCAGVRRNRGEQPGAGRDAAVSNSDSDLASDGGSRHGGRSFGGGADPG